MDQNRHGIHTYKYGAEGDPRKLAGDCRDQMIASGYGLDTKYQEIKGRAFLTLVSEKQSLTQTLERNREAAKNLQLEIERMQRVNEKFLRDIDDVDKALRILNEQIVK